MTECQACRRGCWGGAQGEGQVQRAPWVAIRSFIPSMGVWSAPAMSPAVLGAGGAAAERTGKPFLSAFCISVRETGRFYKLTDGTSELIRLTKDIKQSREGRGSQGGPLEERTLAQRSLRKGEK